MGSTATAGNVIGTILIIVAAVITIKGIMIGINGNDTGFILPGVGMGLAVIAFFIADLPEREQTSADNT